MLFCKYKLQCNIHNVVNAYEHNSVIKLLATYHYTQHISVEHIQSIWIYLDGFDYHYSFDLSHDQIISLKPNNSKTKIKCTSIEPVINSITNQHYLYLNYERKGVRKVVMRRVCKMTFFLF